jgi:predicted TIM-barrel fold metal-dependent hydrolase
MSRRVDVNAFIGEYPFRRVPGTTPRDLLEAMDRVGTDVAWVSHLTAIFWDDPMAGNTDLYRMDSLRLRPVPAIHPGRDRWQDAVPIAKRHDAPAVRADPTRWGLDPLGPEMCDLLESCAAAGLPLLLAVRLEDGRQKNPRDRTAELEPWMVRAWIRSNPTVRLIVTHADREFVEQVHFGATPGEADRIHWDICWIWGPPEDHLALLLRTVGVERFVFGTGMPLRIPETSLAKLDLLDLPAGARDKIESGNSLG